VNKVVFENLSFSGYLGNTAEHGLPHERARFFYFPTPFAYLAPLGKGFFLFEPIHTLGTGWLLFAEQAWYVGVFLRQIIRYIPCSSEQNLIEQNLTQFGVC